MIGEYKAVIYDWDGTLVDSTDWIVGAHNHVRESFGLRLWTKNDIFSSTGNVSSRSSRELYPEIFGDQASKALELLYAYTNEYNLDGAKPFEGADTLLKVIQNKGMHQGVVSNKKHEPLNEMVDYLNWRKYFSSVVGAGYCDSDKPSAEPLLEAIRQIDSDLRPGDVLYVGDTVTDLMTARNAGCDAAFIQSDGARPDLIAQYHPKYACMNVQALISCFDEDCSLENRAC